jgi:Uma2 family endonuclease
MNDLAPSCPTCGRGFTTALDYALIDVVSVERLPVPEAVDEYSGVAQRKRMERRRRTGVDALHDGINLTPQIEQLCQQAEVIAYFEQISALKGQRIRPQQLLPPMSPSSSFRWAHPVSETGLYLALTEAQPAGDTRVTEISVHTDGPNLGSAGGPTLQFLGPLLRVGYRGCLAKHGTWSEDQYFAIEALLPVELVNGCLESLPSPTLAHQLIVQCLSDHLTRFVRTPEVGFVLFAPLPVRLRNQLIREPDVMFFRPERVRGRKYPEGADLVMEVVSEGEENRKRDLIDKRAEYASAGVSEYWIVDPEERQIIVLTLAGSEYLVHGEFRAGSITSSVLLPGFSAPVDVVFAAGEAAC